MLRGEFAVALELARQAVQIAEKVQDDNLQLEAHYAVGAPLLWTGRFLEAQEHFERGMAFHRPDSYRAHAFFYGQDPRVFCLSYAALGRWILGYPDQARITSNLALSFAKQSPQVISLAVGLCFVGILAQQSREVRAISHFVDQVISLSKERDFPYWWAFGTILRGWGKAQEGQAPEAIDLIRQGLTSYQNTGAESVRPYFLSLLADAYGKAGQADQAHQTLAEGLTLVQRTGESWCEAELHRLKGELTLQKGAGDWGLGTGFPTQQVPSLKPLVPWEVAEEVEGYFLKAIDVAQQQQAKSFELRATVSLARLWQQQGKLAEAHHMLSSIYNWFTEGFDTKDAQEAKALLGTLSEGH
jgi:predicted ATPase